MPPQRLTLIFCANAIMSGPYLSPKPTLRACVRGLDSLTDFRIFAEDGEHKFTGRFSAWLQIEEVILGSDAMVRLN